MECYLFRVLEAMISNAAEASDKKFPVNNLLRKSSLPQPSQATLNALCTASEARLCEGDRASPARSGK